MGVHEPHGPAAARSRGLPCSGAPDLADGRLVCRGHSRCRARNLRCGSCGHERESLPAVSAATTRWRFPTRSTPSTLKTPASHVMSEMARLGGVTTRTQRLQKLSSGDLMQNEFQRVAIVNRGEAAMRFIHAAREFNQEHGTTTAHHCASLPSPTAMPCSSAKPTRQFLSAPPSFIDPQTQHLKSSYVDYGRLEQALDRDARRCRLGGMGLCCRTRRIRRSLPRDGHRLHRPRRRCDAPAWATRSPPSVWPNRPQIPVAPWSGGPVETLDDACAHAQRLGFPLLIKATAGGGGRGIRHVHSPDQSAASL